MKKNKIVFLALALVYLLGYNNLFSLNDPTTSSALPVFNNNVSAKQLDPNAPHKKHHKKHDLEIALQAFGGGEFNHLNIGSQSPFAGVGLLLDYKKKFTNAFFLAIKDKTKYHKNFTGALNTKYTLDELYEYAKLELGVEKNNYSFGARVSYYWVYRPSWPDLYQPNPLGPGLPTDPNFGAYLPTDRNSFHKLIAALEFEYSGISKFTLKGDGGYKRNIQYIDPNFNANIPFHLTPTTYGGIVFDLEGIYEASPTTDLQLSNDFEWRSYDIALARDAVTGLTHATTTPNQLYSQINNETKLAATFKSKKSHIEFTPFFGFIVNVDPFQGYYSYLGIEPGLQLEGKIHRFSYALKVSFEMQNYGANGFDPAKTQDKKALYKYYLKGGLELKYKIHKHVELFLDGEVYNKWTNYPSYTPGQPPVAGKNYSINFSFANYLISSGVTFKFL